MSKNSQEVKAKPEKSNPQQGHILDDKSESGIEQVNHITFKSAVEFLKSIKELVAITFFLLGELSGYIALSRLSSTLPT